MRFFFDYNDDISRLGVWQLVTLSSERDCLSTLHSLIDMDLEKLFIGKDFLSFAIETAVLRVYDLSAA